MPSDPYCDGGAAAVLQAFVKQCLDLRLARLRDQPSRFPAAFHHHQGGLIGYLVLRGDGGIPVGVPVHIDEGDLLVIALVGGP